ncbi:F-box domain-containing protein [Mycena sanguinolenta]|uniref:F-box domain-containing protein n=1 Tax=Mycena sanguinolenta TaxID=230812 RepID=A0A8H7DHI6_9AGAR|nr:F-box domain-containing protein [Mycena sanguinolenta]
MDLSSGAAYRRMQGSSSDMQRCSLLDSGGLEALPCRLAQFGIKWESSLLSPICNWCLYLPQCITWLRLVAGTWVFVASSDNYVSKVSCWDLTLVSRGSEGPLSEAYLPGQVETGRLEVQDSGVVLALGLGPEFSAVHVISLRKHSGGHAFSELGRIEGSSHVLMLSGNLIECAVRIIPGLDITGRRFFPTL